MYFYC